MESIRADQEINEAVHELAKQKITPLVGVLQMDKEELRARGLWC